MLTGCISAATPFAPPHSHITSLSSYLHQSLHYFHCPQNLPCDSHSVLSSRLRVQNPLRFLIQMKTIGRWHLSPITYVLVSRHKGNCELRRVESTQALEADGPRDTTLSHTAEESWASPEMSLSKALTSQSREKIESAENK